MVKHFSIVLSMIVLSFTSARAQQSECFAVMITKSTNGGNLGSIRVNKCTGETWVLTRTTLRNGTSAERWFPINVEKAEAILQQATP